MHKFAKYIPFFLFLGLSILLHPSSVSGQERDTTRIEIQEDQKDRQSLNLNRNRDRSMSGGSMTEMGTYNVPSETQYYERPFKGQKYLDMAVEAYREELENNVGENWYWQFLKAVSPFINLQLGAFETLQMEYVDRDHPLFKSYKDREKKQ